MISPLPTWFSACGNSAIQPLLLLLIKIFMIGTCLVVVACAVEMWINPCKTLIQFEIGRHEPVDKAVHDMRKTEKAVEIHGGVFHLSTGSTWVPQRGHVENYLKSI